MCKNKIICKFCGRVPEEIPSYVQEAKYAEGYDVDIQEWVKDDGTYNPMDKTFVCTDCYISHGSPSNAELALIPRPDEMSAKEIK